MTVILFYPSFTPKMGGRAIMFSDLNRRDVSVNSAFRHHAATRFTSRGLGCRMNGPGFEPHQRQILPFLQNIQAGPEPNQLPSQWVARSLPPSNA